MTITENMVRLTAADGFTFDAFMARPAAAPKGGLVILQEIFGMTDQLKSVVRSYAENGYQTILPALFDRVAPKTVVPFETPDAGRDVMLQVPREKAFLDIDAAAKAVYTGNGVSVLGFCWGGGLALGAAGALDLRSAIAFYGTRLLTFLDTPPRCPMLFHFGETDVANTPPETIVAVKEAIPAAETHVYEAGHAFANDARKTYVAAAAIPAHERSLAFLDRHHGRK